ncbi:sortase family protein [Hoyosella subflava]|uniref:Peptidase C60, sortase A and B n=1 Tax=Hoyosella subflava (strain DSM 45089 / JCM 17490 / NBRC 109087 / DQS3-9A1) TaxID=443218 RepID=F6EI54_HOYSD|nr:sortase [Hoyosella subflava]AEF41161.1 Peptidase C60, sortase A and B [Hoyosella subflava DQS3-9A1]
MRKRRYGIRALAAALAFSALSAAGCSRNTETDPVNDWVSAPIGQPAPHDEAAVAEPGEPRRIAFARPDGETYFASDIYPDPVYRGGPDGTELNPDTELPVRWAEAGLPGAETGETVVVVGHNYTDRIAPFHHLRDVSIDDGIILDLGHAVLTYRVEAVHAIEKGTMLGEHHLRQHTAGRLVLANCDVLDGSGTGDNYLVVAQLEM